MTSRSAKPGSRLLGAAALGYLLGTIPSADLAARIASRGTVNLRAAGSGNPGATNAASLLGPRWGAGVMAADIAKGFVACQAARLVAGDSGAYVAGTAAVVGHCYPVWSGFRGGKGVATSVGQCLATFPAYVPIDFAVAALGATPRWKRRAFAATGLASIAWTAAGVAWWRRGWPNGWGPRPSALLPLSAAATSAIIATRFYQASRAETARSAQLSLASGTR